MSDAGRESLNGKRTPYIKKTEKKSSLLTNKLTNIQLLMDNHAAQRMEKQLNYKSIYQFCIVST